MRRRYILIPTAVALVAIGLAVVLSRTRSAKRPTQVAPAPSSTHSITDRSSVDPRTYNTMRAKISNERIVLWSRYQRASTTNEKEAIIAQARQSLVRSVYDEIFPYWYGTGWDFYGTT